MTQERQGGEIRPACAVSGFTPSRKPAQRSPVGTSTGPALRPWAVIDKGFEHGAERIEFASKAGGIFKPRQMSAALSIKTTMPRAGRPLWYRDQGAGIDGQTGFAAHSERWEVSSAQAGDGVAPMMVRERWLLNGWGGGGRTHDF